MSNFVSTILGIPKLDSALQAFENLFHVQSPKSYQIHILTKIERYL